MNRVIGLIAGMLSIVAAPVCRAGPVVGFVENRGQVDARVHYYMEGPSTTIYVTAEALVFDLRAPAPADVSTDEPLRPARAERERGAPNAPPGTACAVYLRFDPGMKSPRIEARGRLPGHSNFFLGHDPARWRADVLSYEEVVYRDLWPRVDLVLRSHGGQLVYEAVAAGGGVVPAALFRYEGADQVVQQGDAEVWAETPAGRLVEVRGARGAGKFLVEGAASAEISADKNDPSALIWSTLLGGNSEDIGYAIALDQLGNPMVTGTTWSSDFPTTPGADDISHNEYRDVFVAKFSSTGSELLWCTDLGGSLNDDGDAIALDASGNAVVTGSTRSTGFPTTPGAFDETFNGSSNDNAFVAKLSSAGNELIWSTFLGRSAAGYALVLDAAQNPILTGMTSYSSFPTTAGAYDITHNGGRDVFVAKFSSTGSALLWSTFLGGSTDDWGLALERDASGNHVVSGYTWSSNFPTTPGAYDETWNGGNTDAFVAKLSSTGSELLWSTYLGGGSTDDGYGLALDASGNPIVTGRTASANFPVTAGAYDTDYFDSYDVFVSKLSDTGSELLWSTFLGGHSNDVGRAIVVNASGNPVLTGSTNSNNFPTTSDAYDTSHNLSDDVFVARLSSTGGELLYCTFLGGSSIDLGLALVLDSTGKAVVTGQEQSTNFPTTPGAYDTSPNGNYDVVVAKLDLRGAQTDVSDPAVSAFPVILSTPNPFNGRVVIRYTLAREISVTLGVYDVRGRLVAPLAAGPRGAGVHSEIWNGRAADGRFAAAGVYFVRLQAAAESVQEQIVLLR